ncbi:MAG TPA: hypothetical protein VFJ07_10000 [Streptosporangiaceae bacterium]|nr:hypothetical protein [Streptosporangiaceae bacterium]
MIKNLVVVASGGALAFGLAGAVSPAMALASVAHPTGVTRANLPMPDGTPIIRDSSARMSGTGHIKPSAPPDTPTVRGSGARLGCVHPGHLGLWNPAAPPTVRDSVAQNAPPTIRDAKARPSGAGHVRLSFPSDPPIIRDSTARPGGARCVKLTNPGPTPIIRDSTAKLGDPDDGGQVTQAAARLGDPDDGGQVQVFAALGDPDDGGQ